MIALMTASAAWVGYQVSEFRAFQMDMDEAVHATHGLDMVSTVLRGSFGDLWDHTVKPHWYPPLHGYTLGAWF